MKMHNHPETQSDCIALKPHPEAEVREIAGGSYEAGEVEGFDINRASPRSVFATLETVSLPMIAIRAA
jgi:hypothetical protein